MTGKALPLIIRERCPALFALTAQNVLHHLRIEVFDLARHVQRAAGKHRLATVKRKPQSVADRGTDARRNASFLDEPCIFPRRKRPRTVRRDAVHSVCKGQERREHRIRILITEYAAYHRKAPSGEHTRKSVFERLGALGIVRPVEYEGRLPPQKLKACGPACAAKPVFERRLAYRKATGAQHLDGLQNYRRIFELMVAEQRYRVAFAVERKALPVKALRRAMQSRKVHRDVACPDLTAAAAEHLRRLAAAVVAHDGAARFYDACLRRRNGGDRVAEVLRVFKSDVHYDRRCGRVDDVRAVKLAAESHLKHHDVAALFQKPLHGDRRYDLKLARRVVHFLHKRDYALREPCKLRIGNIDAVYLHPLVKAPYIRRRVKSCAIARRHKHRGQHCAGGAFSVCPRNVDKAQLFVRIAEHGEKLSCAEKPKPRRCGAAFYVFYRLVTRHCAHLPSPPRSGTAHSRSAAGGSPRRPPLRRRPHTSE